MKILVLSILLFGVFISGCVKEFTLDKYDLYATEGWIACIVAAEQSIPQPDKPNIKKCTCNGTGKVRTGDGINETQCPCGDKCQCGQTRISVHKKRCIMFTSPKNCKPCKVFDKNIIPELKKQNWTFGGGESLVEIVICENKDNEWFTEQYKELREKNEIDLSNEGIPLFVLIEGEKVIDIKVGIQTAKGFTDFFYQVSK